MKKLDYSLMDPEIYETAFGVKPEKISWVIRPLSTGQYEWGILQDDMYLDFGYAENFTDAQREVIIAALVHKWKLDGDSGEFLL